MNTLLRSTLTVVSGTTLAAPSWAHSGHGLLGTHWHATDTVGFLALGAVVVGVGIWLSGRK
jgi:hypothetical protein